MLELWFVVESDKVILAETPSLDSPISRLLYVLLSLEL